MGRTVRRTAPTAVVTVATRTRTLYSDASVVVHELPTGHVLPWRIARRGQLARTIGLSYVRTLGERGDVIAVTVTDGRRPLASWRRMAGGLGGFTGTHARPVETIVRELPTDVIARGGGPIVVH